MRKKRGNVESVESAAKLSEREVKHDEKTGGDAAEK